MSKNRWRARVLEFCMPEPLLFVLCLEKLETDLCAAVLEQVAGADCWMIRDFVLKPGLTSAFSSLLVELNEPADLVADWTGAAEPVPPVERPPKLCKRGKRAASTMCRFGESCSLPPALRVRWLRWALRTRFSAAIAGRMARGMRRGRRRARGRAAQTEKLTRERKSARRPAPKAGLPFAGGLNENHSMANCCSRLFVDSSDELWHFFSDELVVGEGKRSVARRRAVSRIGAQMTNKSNR